MFETKDYGLDLEEKTEGKRLPDSTIDLSGQENQQLEEAKQKEKNYLRSGIENELSGLMSSVEYPKIGFDDPEGNFGMEALDIKPERVVLG